MAFCKNCGKEIDNQAVICPTCGVAQSVTQAVVDNGGFGFGLLGCCFPVVGLILWLVWKDTKPVTAKSSIKGAITGFILQIILGFIYGIAIVMFGINMGMYY